MTADDPDPSALAWPHYMLRYVGTDDPEALNDLMWSVGGSPPWGGVSYEEAAAVYELLESYSGPGQASDAAYAAVLAFLEPKSAPALTIEVFRCADAIQSDSEGYGPRPVKRGLELTRRLGHAGAEASFLAFDAGLSIRDGDDKTARDLTRQALDTFLELAETDESYARRVGQLAVNAVSLTARAGDLEQARELLDDLAELMDADLAEQLRVALSRAR
jgi:hypothetical protein